MDKIDNPKFDDWIFQDNIQHIKKVFEARKELPGMLINCYNKDKMIGLVGNFADDEEKLRFLKIAKTVVMAYNITHYIVNSEVWVSKVLESDFEKNERVAPCDDPNRIEALMMMSVSFARIRSSLYEIKRIGKSRIKLARHKDSENASLKGGALVELLPQRGYVFPFPGRENELIEKACNFLSMSHVMINPVDIDIPEDCKVDG